MQTTIDKTDDGFAMIPNAVLDADLKPDCKLVLCGLIRCCYGKKTVAEISQAGLAVRLRMDRKKVRSALSDLSDLTIIKALGDGVPGRKEKYELHLDRIANLGTVPQRPGENQTQTWGPFPTNNTEANSQTKKTKPKLGAISQPEVGAAPEVIGNGTADCSVTSDLGNSPQVPKATALSAVPFSLAPDGTVFDELAHSAWLEANRVPERVGGEPFNPGRLDKLIEEFGEERVWLEARWFPRRLASMKNPPEKSAPLFIAAVEGNYRFDTRWPEFSRYRHGVVSDDERAAMPVGTDAVKWAEFSKRYEHWYVTDIPLDAQTAVNAAMMAGDWAVVSLVADDPSQTRPTRTKGTCR